MTTDTATLKDLVEVLNDGKKFYEEASTKVDNIEFKQLFSHMAQTKRSIAADLKAKIENTGTQAPDGGSFSGSVRKTYAEIVVKLSKTPNIEYVSQLEEFEDRIVKAFKDATSKSDDTDVRAIANKYLPQVLQDHSKMSSLKHQMTGH